MKHCNNFGGVTPHYQKGGQAVVGLFSVRIPKGGQR